MFDIYSQLHIVVTIAACSTHSIFNADRRNNATTVTTLSLFVCMLHWLLRAVPVLLTAVHLNGYLHLTLCASVNDNTQDR
jgi:uncharacterized MnhB-related membrane protein